MKILNRDIFFDTANKELEQNRIGVIYAMVACDISNFTAYNEKHGHEAGNQLIEETKESLAKFADTVYKNNKCLVGYLGNDDFALFIPIAHGKAENVNEVYESIKANIHSYFFSDNTEKTSFPLKFGVFAMEGLVGAFSGCNAILMHARAIQSLNSVKKDYNATVSIHDINKWADYQNNQMIMMEAADALQNGEFQFYVQPKYDMINKKIIGSEALVRWVDTDTGNIKRYPNEFVPLFEKNGFITKVDLSVWEKVCMWQRSLIDRHIEPLPCSINISAKDFANIDVAGAIYDLMTKYNLPMECIEAEITESAYAGQFDRVCDQVIRMRDMGIKVLIDDFGSAYSNLNRLVSMEFDAIKTDMRFLHEEDSKKALAVMGFIINVAQLLNVPVIAEGVETDEHEKQLIENNCSIAQGFNYYKPMSVDDFEKELREQRKIR